MEGGSGGRPSWSEGRREAGRERTVDGCRRRVLRSFDEDGLGEGRGGEDQG